MAVAEAPVNAEITDETLMKRYLDGEESAFEIVYRRRREGLRRFLARKCRSEALGQDLAQEVWFKLIKACQNGGYTAEAKFTTYLYRLARNNLIDWYRKHGRHEMVELDDEMGHGDTADPSMGEAKDPERLYADTERSETLMAAIDELPEAQKTALLMVLDQHNRAANVY
jgi:RNA polymerase sigma-70 factor (ECF subfamily)